MIERYYLPLASAFMCGFEFHYVSKLPHDWFPASIAGGMFLLLALIFQRAAIIK